MKKLLIVGAKADGQAPVALEAIEDSLEWETAAFADENPDLWGTELLGLPVLGPPADAEQWAAQRGITGAFVAIGDAAVRVRLSKLCRDIGLALPTFVHRAAYVSRRAYVGEGGFIGAGAQVLPGAIVGEHVRVNAGAVISHHVQIGVGTTIGPNATLTGRSSTGECAFVGAGSTVLNDVRIGDGATIGAGAVVTRDVPPGITVVGVPAKPLAPQRSSTSPL